MRAVGTWTLLSMLALGCGGGGAGGAPAPQGLRVHLQFARNPGRIRYQVHRKSWETLFDRVTLRYERTLWVSEVFEDSLEAHLIHVRIDSGMGLPKTPVSVGPFPGFMGWFNDRRDRIDTLATDRSVESYRSDIFDGSIPLPPDTVRVGDTWDVGPRPRMTFLRSPESPLKAAVHGVVRRLSVLGPDTVVVLELVLDVRGKFTPRQGGHDVEVHGQETGEEMFSVNRGVTLRLALKGSVEWDTDIMGPRGLQQVYTIAHSESERNIIP